MDYNLLSNGREKKLKISQRFRDSTITACAAGGKRIEILKDKKNANSKNVFSCEIWCFFAYRELLQIRL